MSSEMNKLWFEKFNEKDIVDNFELPEIFILYPTATWKHKNHLRLIKAVIEIIKKDNINISLICTGSFDNNHFKEIIKYINQNNLRKTLSFLELFRSK